MKTLLLFIFLPFLLAASQAPLIPGEILPVNGPLVEALVLADGSTVVVTIDNFNRTLHFKIDYFNEALPKGGAEARSEPFPNNWPPSQVIVRLDGRTVHIFGNWTYEMTQGETRHYVWELPEVQVRHE